MAICSKCGENHDRVGQSYCRPCQTAYARERRKVTGYRVSPEAKKRDSARSYANVHERRGYLHRTPCCVCSSMETELHHPDYDRPLHVFSLCKQHHIDWHKHERANPAAVFLEWLPAGSQPALIGLHPESVPHGINAAFFTGHPRA